MLFSSLLLIALSSVGLVHGIPQEVQNDKDFNSMESHSWPEAEEMAKIPGVLKAFCAFFFNQAQVFMSSNYILEPEIVTIDVSLPNLNFPIVTPHVLPPPVQAVAIACKYCVDEVQDKQALKKNVARFSPQPNGRILLVEAQKAKSGKSNVFAMYEEEDKTIRIAFRQNDIPIPQVYSDKTPAF